MYFINGRFYDSPTGMAWPTMQQICSCLCFDSSLSLECSSAPWHHCKLPLLLQDLFHCFLLNEASLTILFESQPSPLPPAFLILHVCLTLPYKGYLFQHAIKSIKIKCNHDWSHILNWYNNCHLLCLWLIASLCFMRAEMSVHFAIKITQASLGQCLAQGRHFKNIC